LFGAHGLPGNAARAGAVAELSSLPGRHQVPGTAARAIDGDGDGVARLHPEWAQAERPGHDIRSIDPDVTWPQAVQAITGRAITSVLQNTRARRTNPFEADALGLPDATIVFVSHLTTYDAHDHPIEHSRYTWPIETVRISDHYTYPANT